jgi:hypothetical protein
MSGLLIFRVVAHCFRTLSAVVFDLVQLAFLTAHSRGTLAAENPSSGQATVAVPGAEGQTTTSRRFHAGAAAGLWPISTAMERWTW